MTLNVGTYEAQIIELLGDRGDVIRYTCADGTTISKGSVLILADERTAQKCTVTGIVGTPWAVAGIASHDKEASDGSTTIGAYTNGIFEMRVDANTTLHTGDLVTISGTNNQIIKATAADVISGAVLGKCLGEGTAAEEIAVRVLVR